MKVFYYNSISTRESRVLTTVKGGDMLDPELTERQNKILLYVLEHFIQTAEPLGSRSLARDYDLEVSPATVRNSMSDLEELDYLTKVHGSSGRVPSDLSYRLYVKNILEEINQRNPMEEGLLKKDFTLNHFDAEAMIRSSTKFLSQMSGYTAVSIIERSKSLRVLRMELLPYSENTFALILLFENGEMSTTMIETIFPVTEDFLRKINYQLNRTFSGYKIKNIYDLLTDQIPKIHSDEIRSLFSTISERGIRRKDQLDISIEGLSMIFNLPEFYELDKAREFIRFLETEENLEKLYKNSSEEYLQVKIGDENEEIVLQDKSILSSTFYKNGHRLGKVFIIGPKRMEYKKTIGALATINRRFNDWV